MLQRRAVIDYALARRAALADLQRGVLSRQEVCDAHPDLLRAARHHGEPTQRPCPLCRTELCRPDLCRTDRPLVAVTYVYGDELGESSGRTRAQSELVALSLHHADLRVYVVEVCRACSWNHLVTSYAIGSGEVPARRPTRRRVAGR